MDQVLIRFVAGLQKTGVPVSTAEVLDACRAVEVVGLAEKAVFKDTLRCVLIKRGRDIPVFDALFDLYFTRGPKKENSPESEKEQDQSMGEWLNDLIHIHQPDISVTTELIMTGQFGALSKLMSSRGRGLGLERMENPLQVNFFQRKLRQEMNLDLVRDEAGAFISKLEGNGLAPELSESLSDYVTRNVARVEEEIRRLVRKEMARNRFLFLKRMEKEDLTRKPVAGLSDRDVMEMRPTVERLARQLKDRLSRRLKRAEKGRFDLKTTLRKNIGYGGPLPELTFRCKKPGKPQIVALCDVSNSVRNFSRFMLLFLYTLGEVVARLRSFVFVGDLAEVTGLFQRHELSAAVSMAAAGKGLRYAYRTDYGSSLLQFSREFLPALNSRTTVFILGDARNNFYHPHEEALAAMTDKTKRLIWLNPEPKINWRLGDSIMEVYSPYCQTVAECGNLKQLAGIIEDNLLI